MTIPAQTARGTLQIVVSDADFLNRNVQSLAASSQGQLAGLEELMQLINRERHNDRLYATLFQSTPTMLVEDKELPNVPSRPSTFSTSARIPATPGCCGNRRPGSGRSKCIR